MGVLAIENEWDFDRLRDQGREHEVANREIAATEKAASELKAAQYYINATLGDAANAYALDNLGAVTAHLIQQDKRLVQS